MNKRRDRDLERMIAWTFGLPLALALWLWTQLRGRRASSATGVAIPQAIPVLDPEPAPESPAMPIAVSVVEPPPAEMRYRKQGRRYLPDPNGSYVRVLRGKQVRYQRVLCSAA